VKPRGFNVLAAFADMGAARAAIEALGRTGISGEKISLHGPAAQTAADQPETATPDAVAMQALTQSAVIGGIWGGLAGIAFGIPASILIYDSLDREVTALTVLSGAFLGGLGMSGIGALIGIMRLPADTETWELAMHEDTSGLAIVGVHSEDETEIKNARESLDRQSPLDIRQVAGTVVRSPVPDPEPNLPQHRLRA
jgi:hypothetical protein